MTAPGGVAAYSCAALGTTATVLVTDGAALEPAASVLRADLDAVDRACSRFRPDSELTAVNASAGRPVVVSAVLGAALAAALRAARLTGGVVDPTVGRCVMALGYDRDFGLVAPELADPVAPIGPAPGWQSVAWEPASRTVQLAPGTALDLGATAKAYAADRIAQRIAQTTGAGALVNLGGDIAVAGAPPASGWLIRVTDDHSAARQASGQTIRVRGGGVATSSTAVRSWRRGGRLRHHIVDPASGDTPPQVWRTVSVAAASCVDANIASTAGIVLGDRAPGWIAEAGLPARLVRPDGGVVVVSGWPQDGGSL